MQPTSTAIFAAPWSAWAQVWPQSLAGGASQPHLGRPCITAELPACLASVALHVNQSVLQERMPSWLAQLHKDVIGATPCAALVLTCLASTAAHYRRTSRVHGLTSVKLLPTSEKQMPNLLNQKCYGFL